MEQYHQLLKRILGVGDVVLEPRTQEYTLGISSWESVYQLGRGFPLMTTKKVPSRLPFEELFWKLRGERNVKTLFDNGIHIWDRNAFDNYLKRHGEKEKFPKHSLEWEKKFEEYKEGLKDKEFARDGGDLGPVYGFQWRHWKAPDGNEIDPLEKLLRDIKEKPYSRYHVLCAWNPGELGEMAIGPCPFWHQFSVFGNSIDLTMVQRSCDVYLGVPFNIAQDSLLLKMVAKETGLKARAFNHHYINAHIYLGVPPRAEFWTQEENVLEFQNRFKKIREKQEYLTLRDWYLSVVKEESGGNERKDHIPFILEQLSKTPRKLSTIRLYYDSSLFEAITKNTQDIIRVENYNPEIWDARAEMAT